VTVRFQTAEDVEREAGLANAALAVQRGQLIVLPTDTAYGVGADAFSPAAVDRLLMARGRGRAMPPPVLVAAATTLDAALRPRLHVHGHVHPYGAARTDRRLGRTLVVNAIPYRLLEL